MPSGCLDAASRFALALHDIRSLLGDTPVFWWGTLRGAHAPGTYAAGRALDGGGVASGGLRELIPTIARTAVVAGVDGIFMEVRHCCLFALCMSITVVNTSDACIFVVLLALLLSITMACTSEACMSAFVVAHLSH